MPARPLRARIGHLPSMPPPRFELLRAQPADQEIDTSHLAAGAPGTFTNATGTDFCANCEAGTYQSSKAGTACVDCPAGSACEAGSSAPIACPAGTWSSTPRLGTSDGCITCPVGAYCPAGAVLPLLCQAGTHGGGQTGLSDPLCAGSCPSDQIDGVSRPRVTMANGTVDITGCQCRDGLFLRGCTACELGNLTGNECVRCPDNTQCQAAGVTLERLPIKRGYWRATAASLEVRLCNLEEACVGGTPPAVVNETIWAEHQCAVGYRVAANDATRTNLPPLWPPLAALCPAALRQLRRELLRRRNRSLPEMRRQRVGIVGSDRHRSRCGRRALRLSAVARRRRRLERQEGGRAASLEAGARCGVPDDKGEQAQHQV